MDEVNIRRSSSQRSVDLRRQAEMRKRAIAARNMKRKRIIVAIAILIVICLGLGTFQILVHSQKNEITNLTTKTHENAVALQGLLETTANTGTDVADKAMAEIRKENGSFISEEVRQKLITGETDGLKVVFLSFDDGPSDHTGEILDTLKKYNIKATFFVNGRESEGAKALYKRITDEGHTLANHTYSHNYDLYNNTAAFLEDIAKLQNLLNASTQTGPSGLMRFPGGSLMATMDQVQAVYAAGYNYADWNVTFGDGASTVAPTPDVVARVVSGVREHNVSTVLGHPESESKTSSREALPQIIETLQSEGYTFLPMEKDFQYPKYIEKK